jgi:rhomboid protease GluP
MKENFVNALTKRLVSKSDYMPLRDQEGNLVVSNDVKVLTKNSFGSILIVELLDGDKLSCEEIESRLQNNRAVLAGMNMGMSQYFFEIFIFENEPGQDKMDIILKGQFQNSRARKYLKCLSVNLAARSVEKLFKLPLTDTGLSKNIKWVFNNTVCEEAGDVDFEQLVLEKEKEYEVEVKAKIPFITYMLVGINILVSALLFLYGTSTGKGFNELLIDFGAKENSSIMAGQFWRLFTPIFLHSDIVHLGLNCYLLYALGCDVEKMYGRVKFITVYLTAGIIGNIASFIFSYNPAVGASGAIFGLLGTLLYFGLERPAIFKVYFGYNVIITIVANLAYGFSRPGIDNFAHIGGLIGGFLVTGIFSKSGHKRWYLNRSLYVVLTISVICGGLFYGFNNELNKFALRVNNLEQLVDEKDWGSVEELANEILAEGPKNDDINASALWGLCWAEYYTGKFESVLAHANELVNLNPVNGHYILGVTYATTGEFDLAEKELLEAKRLGGKKEIINELLDKIKEVKNESFK